MNAHSNKHTMQYIILYTIILMKAKNQSAFDQDAEYIYKK